MEDDVIGIFVGLESSSNEYIAWLIAPYRQNFAVKIGSLLLIQSVQEMIVVRVMDYIPRGEFVSSMGEKWLNEIASQNAINEIGFEIKKSKISYKVRVKVLGSLSSGKFYPGLRLIPQITSKVRSPNSEECRNIINQALEDQSANGVEIGVYDLNRDIKIIFDQIELNAKRTFIFARAGYGKSNLMKVLSSKWKSDNGGLLIFDADGEYAVTDKKNRPGIMDKRSAILVTNQHVSEELNNVHKNVKIDLTKLPHKMIVPILIQQSKHEMVFFAKLMAMDEWRWPELVRLLAQDGWNADHNEINRIVLNRSERSGDSTNTESEMKPILNNLVRPIQALHSDGSPTIPIIEKALGLGKVVIFDISRVDAQIARDISSIIVKRIFNTNQANFIKHGGNNLIRVTFVLEEAHTVLSSSSNAPKAFVELAKEGRKYGLGGIFITQQPGSISNEIVSQGDNFFVFHLLSKTDLNSLSNANAHYSNDIITQILNEPIKGKSYMWTSHQPFVIPVMIENFEDGGGVISHQSKTIQEKDKILEKIMNDIRDELNDPVMKSIYEKFSKTESEMQNADIKEKTISLFQKLDNNERKYLKERKYIQDGTDGQPPFAVTFPFYYKLKNDYI